MEPSSSGSRAEREPVTVFSAGHSNHAFEVFLALIVDAGVRAVADVRSQPFSRRHPHFSRPALEASLAREGLGYVWLGVALGGRPSDPSVYRDGRVDAALIGEQRGFQAGIERLIAMARELPTAMICAERDPRHCHRSALIAPALVARGVEVVHLLVDRRIDHRDLATPARERPSNLDLFDD